MAYDLEQLGASGFQDLAASVTVAVFGPGVEVMGSGRDGGRDMYFEGNLRWSDDQQADEVWTGYTVFQVKHKESLAARPQGNASWLWSQVRKELDHWTWPIDGYEKTPRQLVIITNVGLTPVPDSGGHDQMRQNIANYDAELANGSRDINARARDLRIQRLRRLRRIQKIKFWDRNKLIALLNQHAGVRTAFKALMSVPDLLADLSALSSTPASKAFSARSPASGRLATRV